MLSVVLVSATTITIDDHDHAHDAGGDNVDGASGDDGDDDRHYCALVSGILLIATTMTVILSLRAWLSLVAGGSHSQACKELQKRRDKPRDSLEEPKVS